jgi:hypothetical protein
LSEGSLESEPVLLERLRSTSWENADCLFAILTSLSIIESNVMRLEVLPFATRHPNATVRRAALGALSGMWRSFGGAPDQRSPIRVPTRNSRHTSGNGI